MIGEGVSPDDLFLVQQLQGAPVTFVDDDGAVSAVIVEIEARQNNTSYERSTTYVLQLDDVIGMIAGLTTAGNIAFGRDNVRRAMAAHLGIPPERADRTTRAVDDAVDGAGE